MPRSTRCAPSSDNKIAPLQLAIGAADSFRGYVDLVHRGAYTWQGDQDQPRSPVPAELEAEVARRREQLLEAASEADDDVMTKYLEGEEVSDDELEACVRHGRPRPRLSRRSWSLRPRGGSASRGLLDAIVALSPLARSTVAR